jgi:hypothetical protein
MMPETLSVGTTVYVPSITHKEVIMDCPDCRGEHKWIIRTPSGHSHTIECPRCKGGKSGYEFLRPKRYERTLEIHERVICEVEVRQRKDHKTEDVRTHIAYTTSPHSGSLYPDKIFTSRDAAEDAGAAMMIEDAKREKAEWEKDQKRAEDRAGLDVMAALQSRADKATADLNSKIERLREAMMEGIKYPHGDGPKLTKTYGGNSELTSQSLAEWCNELLSEADLETWSEEDLHEALCHC